MSATVRMGVLRGLDRLLEQLGGNTEQLWADCGLKLTQLNDPDGLIAYEELSRLLEYCAEQLGVFDLGLRIAIAQELEVLGPLALAMQNSETIADAMKCAAAYMYVLSPALTLRINEQGSTTELSLDIQLPNTPTQQARQVHDKAAAYIYRVTSLLAKEAFEPQGVSLPHPPLCDEAVYQQHFGVPVEFNTEGNAVRVSTECMHLPLADRNQHIKQIALDYLRSEAPTPDVTLVERVEQSILRTLGTESCNRDDVAAALAMHPRTLQRHLDSQGLSFNQLRDRIRRSKADYYLRKTQLPLCQVAGMLGYADQTILTRSCRRWFGSTPKVLRAMQA